jgi:hypothetical protein
MQPDASSSGRSWDAAAAAAAHSQAAAAAGLPQVLGHPGRPTARAPLPPALRQLDWRLDDDDWDLEQLYSAEQEVAAALQLQSAALAGEEGGGGDDDAALLAALAGEGEADQAGRLPQHVVSSMIVTCASVGELQEVMSACGQQMNVRHLASCASTLARLAKRGGGGGAPPTAQPGGPRGGRQPAAVNGALRSLKRLTQRLLLALDAVAIAALLHALSKVQHRDLDWIGDLLHVSAPLLDDASPRALSTSAWALAGLRINPSRRWVGAFFEVGGAAKGAAGRGGGGLWVLHPI